MPHQGSQAPALIQRSDCRSDHFPRPPHHDSPSALTQEPSTESIQTRSSNVKGRHHHVHAHHSTSHSLESQRAAGQVVQPHTHARTIRSIGHLPPASHLSEAPRRGRGRARALRPDLGMCVYTYMCGASRSAIDPSRRDKEARRQIRSPDELLAPYPRPADDGPVRPSRQGGAPCGGVRGSVGITKQPPSRHHRFHHSPCALKTRTSEWSSVALILREEAVGTKLRARLSR
jgi:hypothetical protein